MNIPFSNVKTKKHSKEKRQHLDSMNLCAASWIVILISVVTVEGVSPLTASQKSSWWTYKLINIHVTRFLVSKSLSLKWLYPLPPLGILVSVTDANGSRRCPSKQRVKPQNHILEPGPEGFFSYQVGMKFGLKVKTSKCNKPDGSITHYSFSDTKSSMRCFHFSGFTGCFAVCESVCVSADIRLRACPLRCGRVSVGDK